MKKKPIWLAMIAAVIFLLGVNVFKSFAYIKLYSTNEIISKNLKRGINISNIIIGNNIHTKTCFKFLIWDRWRQIKIVAKIIENNLVRVTNDSVILIEYKMDDRAQNPKIIKISNKSNY